MDASETQPIAPQHPLLQDKSVTAAIRIGFIRKVYAILTAQLLATVAVATPVALASEQWWAKHIWVAWAAVAFYVGMSCAVACGDKTLFRRFPQNYIMLGAFTISLGLLVGIISASYTLSSVLLAAGLTCLIFLCLTVYACFTSNDFTGYGPYLVAFLAVLCVFGLTIGILSWCGIHFQWMTMLYNALGVILFSFFIVYDTQLIIGGKHELSIDDYCLAALNLYLDIINLFLALLELTGDRS